MSFVTTLTEMSAILLGEMYQMHKRQALYVRSLICWNTWKVIWMYSSDYKKVGSYGELLHKGRLNLISAHCSQVWKDHTKPPSFVSLIHSNLKWKKIQFNTIEKGSIKSTPSLPSAWLLRTTNPSIICIYIFLSFQ